MGRIRLALLLLLLLIVAPLHAQGPTPAVVQQAIDALLASNAVITGNWTCTGTCTGFGGGGGGGVWGTITGTLSNQTDLQTALNTKVTTSGSPSSGQLAYFSGASAVTGFGDWDGLTLTLPGGAGVSAEVTMSTPDSYGLLWLHGKFDGSLDGGVAMSDTDPAPWYTVYGTSNPQLVVASNGLTQPNFVSAGNADGPAITMFGSAGTLAAPSIYTGGVVNTTLWTIDGLAFSDNGGYMSGSEIGTSLEAAAPNTDHGWPSYFQVRLVGASGTVPQERFRVGSNGNGTFQGLVSANGYSLTGSTQTISGSEVTAPAAPAANGFVLFGQDSGGGKTQICARFNTGSVQCFASEP